MAKKHMLATAKTVEMKAASRKDLNALISSLSKVPSEKGLWSERRRKKIREIIITRLEQ